MKLFSFFSLVFLGACGAEVSDGPCADLCGVLIGECGYSAFPDMASCLDGCAFEASEGQDVKGQAICVSNADCDTFAILECANAHGG